MLPRPGKLNTDEAAAEVADPGGAIISPPPPPKQFIMGFRGLLGSASLRMLTVLLYNKGNSRDQMTIKK